MSDQLSLAERILPQSAQFDTAAVQIMGSLRVAIPAIVQSFDSQKQTVTVAVAILDKLRIGGQQMDVDPGIIADIPISMPRAGGFSLTLPVQAGDECLLVFADGCIDAWHQNGGKQARISGRRHDLSDAFAILGPWSQPRVIANYSTTAAQLRSDDGQTVIEIGAGEVTIKANTVNVQAQTANVTASQKVEINGSAGVDITGAGQVKIDGIHWSTHVHTGGTIMPGSITGPPEEAP